MPSESASAQQFYRQLHQNNIDRLIYRIIEEVQTNGKPSDASLGSLAYYCRFHPEYYQVLYFFLQRQN